MIFTLPRINTERLSLQHFRKSELDIFFNYSRNPALGDNKWCKHIDSPWMYDTSTCYDNIWAITLKSSGCFIGAVGLVRDWRKNQQVLNAGYWIDENYRGNGYASEALRAALDYGFWSMELKAVTAYTLPGNIPSHRTLEKCGFQFDWRYFADQSVHPSGVKEYCYILTRKAHADICER